jgi:hypothetical protein
MEVLLFVVNAWIEDLSLLHTPGMILCHCGVELLLEPLTESLLESLPESLPELLPELLLGEFL